MVSFLDWLLNFYTYKKFMTEDYVFNKVELFLYRHLRF